MSSPPITKNPQPGSDKSLLVAETEFGLSLLSLLPYNESVVISPLSISFALALAHEGAKGKTKEEICNVLLKGVSPAEFTEYYSTLESALIKTKPLREMDPVMRFMNGPRVEFDLANCLFVRDGYELREDYLEKIKENFDASAVTMDFGDGEAAAKAMNKYVSDSTDNMITNVIESATFNDPYLKMIIINALYMKADWDDKFTVMKKEDFFVEEGVKREMTFMYMTTFRGYFEDEAVQVLSIPYKSYDYKFVIVLPKRNVGLLAVRWGLSGKLQDILKKLKSEYVDMAVPKFKIEKEVDLKKMLQKLGIGEAFKEEADFTGIADPQGPPPYLFISDVAHKAIIEVDEAGTKATASTMACLRGGGWPEDPPIEFRADRPFLFFVTYKNHIVFEGQLC